MVISRLVAGIVLLVFGLAVLGSAYDIKSDAQIQFSNLQCNNILGDIEEACEVRGVSCCA